MSKSLFEDNTRTLVTLIYFGPSVKFQVDDCEKNAFLSQARKGASKFLFQVHDNLDTIRFNYMITEDISLNPTHLNKTITFVTDGF